jgi:hypothetical protein
MSTLRVTNVQDTAGANSLTTAQIYNGAAKAWVNFNGTGTVAIRASFNVSSITDNGTGDYTVNFATALADADYAFVASANQSSAAANADAAVVGPRRATNGFSTSSIRFDVGPNSSTSGAAVDSLACSVAIFR